MAVNASPTIEQVQRMLNQFMANDTHLVNEATKWLENYLSNPSSIMSMLHFLQPNHHHSIRQTAAVLLRSWLSKKGNNVDQGIIRNIKKSILNLFIEEQDCSTRKSILEFICLIARLSFPVEEWPEFWQTIFQLTRSGSADHSISAIYVIGEMCSYIDLVNPFMDQIIQVMMHSLNPARDPQIRTEALEIFRKLTQESENDKRIISGLKNCIPSLIEHIKLCINDGSYNGTVLAFECLSDLVEFCPHACNSEVPRITEICIGVLSSQDLDPEIREKAKLVIESFVDFRPSWLTKYHLLEAIIQVAFSIMSEPEDPELPEDEIETSPYYLGWSLLDDISVHVKAKFAFGSIMNRIEFFRNSENPWHRRAAAGAFIAIILGYCDNLKNMIGEIVSYICKLVQENDIFVVRAGCDLMVKFSEVFQDELEPYQSEILPVFCQLLYQRNNSPYVMESVLYASLSCFENFDSSSISDEVFESLMNRLLEILDTLDSYELKGNVLNVISTLAVSVRERFVPYWERVINLSNQFLQLKEPESLILRGRALDCAGAIAFSVGSNVFSIDTIRWFFDNSNEYFKKEDSAEILELRLNFIGNIATTLKEQFLPFTEKSLELILETIKDEINIDFDTKDDELTEILDEEDIEDKYALAYTSGLIDNVSNALDSLGKVAEACGASFLPYIDQCLPHVLKCKGHIHPKVRSYAAYPLEGFSICYGKAFPLAQPWKVGNDPAQFVMDSRAENFLNNVILSVLDTINTDRDVSVTQRNVESLQILLNNFGRPGFDKHFDVIFSSVKKIFDLENFSQVLASESKDEDDSDISQSLLALFEVAGDFMVEVAKNYKTDFLHYFNIFFSFRMYLGSENNNNNNNNNNKFQFFDDIDQWHNAVFSCLAEVTQEVENVKEWPRECAELFLDYAIKGIQDSDTSTRSNAIYLMRMLVEHSSSYGFYSQILDFVGNSIGDPDDQVHDNALGCIGNMIICAPDLLPIDQILCPFINSLPLQIDKLESPYAYGCLLNLLEKNNEHILPLIPDLFKVFVVSTSQLTLTKEIEDKIISAIRFLWERYQNQLQGLTGTLDDGEKENLKMILETN